MLLHTHPERRNVISIEQLRDLTKISDIDILTSLVDELSKKYEANKKLYIVLFHDDFSAYEGWVALLKEINILWSGNSGWKLIDIDTNEMWPGNGEPYWESLLYTLRFVILNPGVKIKIFDKLEYLIFLGNRYKEYAC